MWILGAVVLFVIVKIIIILVLNHPKIKGMIGERKVRKELTKLSPSSYRVLNNIIIKANKGTTQVDHIVISPVGIFVIETKNYKGRIYGNDDSEYWTQSIYGHKTKFSNPIRQNWGHIYALKNLLREYKDLSYHPVILFLDKANLQDLNVKSHVIHLKKLVDTIMNYKGPRHLSHNEIENIYNILSEASINDKTLKEQHIERIKWNTKIRQLKEKALICPKCGGRLTKRDGRYGEFYGCENFPRCKYATNLRTIKVDRQIAELD
jgi:hypothetical protein